MEPVHRFDRLIFIESYFYFLRKILDDIVFPKT